MQIQEIAEKILPLYLHIQRTYQKDYSWAAQEKLLYNLARYRGIVKSRATLNRYLRRLEDAKHIKRIQRTRRDPIHGLQHKSTICIILLAGYHALRRSGIAVWKEIKRCVEKLRFKYPEFAARSTKKMLEAAKRNAGHEEFMRGIAEKLVKLPVID